MIQEQEKLHAELSQIVKIFEASNSEIRPHFLLTGPSGSGKSHTIAQLAEEYNMGYLEINAAQLTKEGTSGNSLSKALAPLGNMQEKQTICFVDEFDKLFVSGNTNDASAHESTNGVQNEFLKILEADHTSVFGDYGKYVSISIKNVLFVFAGAFNGEEDITISRLQEIGVKTEFLGRVGLIFNTTRISLESLLTVLENSSTLHEYLSIFPDVKQATVVEAVGSYIKKHHEKNTLGIRMITALIHRYFICGGNLEEETDIKRPPNKTLSMAS